MHPLTHILALLLLSTLHPTTLADVCARRCLCLNETVDCSKKDFIGVPNVPSNTTELILRDNKLGPLLNGSLVQYDGLELLDLSGNGLDRLDEKMFDGLDSLEVVRLGRNMIRYVPDDIFKNAKNIRELDLSENLLFEVPHLCLKHVVKLRKLILRGNKITDLAFGIRLQTLRNIELVDLSYNQLGTVKVNSFDIVSEWSRVVKTTIDLAFCDLEEIETGAFIKLKGIHGLNLAGNPMLLTSNMTNITVSLSELQRSGIKSLNFSHMEIRKLADIFALFRDINIKKLDISYNDISDITKDDVKFLKAGITYLNVANNNLTTMLNSLCDMEFLRTLDISNNFVQTIPVNFTSKMLKLTKFNAENNQITRVTKTEMKHLKKLKYLNLNNNELVKFEADTVLPKLEKLFVAGNMLSETEGLPKHEFLKEIDLSRNKFETLGPFIFRFCDNISLVNLSRNKIEEIDHQVFTPRVPDVIDLSHNRITSVKYFGWLSAREIYFQNNLIENVDFQAFLSMNRLEILDLSENRLSEFKYNTFKYLTHMRELNLQGNRLRLVEEEDGIFRSMVVLKRLNFANNDIVEIRGGLLKELVSLEYLGFQNNKIHTVDPKSFKTLKNLKVLNLTGNPFRCGCDLLEYQYWLRNVTQRFPDLVKDTCFLPLSRRNDLITDFALETFECSSQMVYIVVFCTLVGVTIIFWAVASVACKVHLKKRRNLNIKKRIMENFMNTPKDFEMLKSLETDITDEKVFKMNGKIPAKNAKQPSLGFHINGNVPQGNLDIRGNSMSYEDIRHAKNKQQDMRKYRLNGFVNDRHVNARRHSDLHHSDIRVSDPRRYSDTQRYAVAGGIATMPRQNGPRCIGAPSSTNARHIAELYGTLTRPTPAHRNIHAQPMYYKRGSGGGNVVRNGGVPRVMETREVTRKDGSKQWV